MKLLKVGLAIMILFTLLVSGCVSKSNYDKLQSDLNTAQESLTAMTADRDAAKVQLTNAQSDLNTAQQSITSVTTDMNAAKSQLTKTQADLNTAQQSLTEVTSDRDSVKTQLAKAQSDLTTAQQSLTTLNSSMKSAQPYFDIARGYLAIMLAGLSNSNTDAVTALSTVTQALSAANDSALKAAWETFLASPEDDVKHAAFIKLLVQRLNENKLKTN